MPHTETLIDYTADKSETSRDTSWDEASQVVVAFSHDPLFIQSLNKNGITIASEADPRYMNLLFNYAEDFCSTHTELLSEDERDRILLIADTPRIISATTELGLLENRRKKQIGRLEQNDFRRLESLKTKIIPYNQRLSGYIAAHPNEKLSQLNNMLINASLDHFSDEGNVEDVVKHTTKGAVYEAVSRQLLDHFGIPFRTATPEEDKHGVDIMLTHQVPHIAIDIKSSLDAIANILGGYDRIEDEKIFYAISPDYSNKSPRSIKIYPGFTPSDLKDRCSLPDDILDEKAAAFLAQLQRAIGELTNTQSNS